MPDRVPMLIEDKKSTRPKGGSPNRFVYQLDNNHKKTQDVFFFPRFFVVVWVWSNPEYSPLTYQKGFPVFLGSHSRYFLKKSGK